MFKNVILGFIAILFIVSCGKPQSAVNVVKADLVIGDHGFTTREENSRKILTSVNPIEGGIPAKRHYELTFLLPDEGSEVVLNSHAQPNLKGGTKVTFLRKDNKLEVKINGEDVAIKNEIPVSNNPITVSVDVHNADEGVVIFVLPRNKRMDIHCEKASGNLWALETKQATVQSVKTSVSKYDHHH